MSDSVFCKLGRHRPRPSFGAILLGSGLTLGLAFGLAPGLAQVARAQVAAGAAVRQPASPRPAGDQAAIVAVVNGDVVSRGDVDNRRRLFALSTGLPVSNEVLDRLTPQVTSQLIDERLRLQEIQRRKIVVSDHDIAAAITEVEQRNGMQPGVLKRRLSADGVDMRTMIDQIRVQQGWLRVLREVLGPQTQVSDAEVDEQLALLKAQTGQQEFRVGEIFIPAGPGGQAVDAQRFADTIIQQLRAGAPFAIVAAQFSQSQTALSGGDLGWVQPNQLDAEVLRIVREMPPGGVSNPVRVPGGFVIVTLRGKREIGNEPATMARVRQVFIPFATRLDPANPTDQQKKALETARGISASAQNCEAMDAASAKLGNAKPADPGELRVETIGAPALRQIVATSPVGKATQPLIAEDGIAVVMVCSREVRNIGLPDKREMMERILNERVELTSRQLMRELQRRAVIDRRA
jgi:peptidyl-prolyl cis-trans isomerase SurA